MATGKSMKGSHDGHGPVQDEDARAAALLQRSESDVNHVRNEVMEAIERQVAAHVTATLETVEKHRDHLVKNSSRALAVVAKAEEARAAEERKAKAVVSEWTCCM